MSTEMHASLGSFPLSTREQALWFLQDVTPDLGVANVGLALYLGRPVQWWALQESIRCVVRRHPMLRSSFRMEEGVPIRVIRDLSAVDIELVVRAATAESLDSDIRGEAGHPFALIAEDPVRAVLFNVDDDRQVLVLTFHHLVFDGMSTGPFLRDLGRAYLGLVSDGTVSGEMACSAPLVVPTEPSAENLDFWAGQVTGIPPGGMHLTGGRYDDVGLAFDGAQVRRDLGPEATELVHGLRRELRVSDNILLLAVFTLLLHHHGAGESVTVGVPVDLRRWDQRELVGPYFATMPLKAPVNPVAAFVDHVKTVRDTFLAGYDHRVASYEAVLRRADIAEYDWRSPFFRHLFNYRVRPRAGELLGGAVTNVERVDTGYCRSDLDFAVSGDGRRYELRIGYACAIHTEGFVRRLAERFEHILGVVAAEPHLAVGSIPMHAQSGVACIVANMTAVDWPSPRTVLGMFLQHAALRPDAIAVESPAGVHTYRRLQMLIGDTVRQLRSSGVGAGAVVGVFAGRTVSGVAAALACWAVGAVCLLVDPMVAPSLLDVQLADAGVDVLLVSQPDRVDLPTRCRRVLMSGSEAGVDGDEAEFVDRACDPDSAALVCYSSGSAGPARGVRVSHRGLANLVRHFESALDVDERGSVGWLSPLTSGASALELFLPLAAGARIAVPSDSVFSDRSELARWVRKADVRVLQATPTVWRELVGQLGNGLRGRTVLSGGELLTPKLARSLLSTGCRLFNLYGLTETTVWSTVHRVGSEDVLLPPAGRPIANTFLEVVDEGGWTCPTGVAGDILIGGAGIAVGDLDSASRIADRFVEHPRHGRMFRTGDRGCWRDDGVLHVCGRRERHVVVSGDRLELGEIEATLEEHPLVRAAAVLLPDGADSNAPLAAFVVRDGGLSAQELQEFIARRLPNRRVLGVMSFVDRMPTSPAGKLDYGRLLLPVAGRSLNNVGDREPVLNPYTSRLVDLWREVLKNPELDGDSDFFRSGGQSVMAALLVARVRREFNVKLPLASVFHFPTPRLLSEEMTRASPATTP